MFTCTFGDRTKHGTGTADSTARPVPAWKGGAGPETALLGASQA